jgi:uncharacterized membrane protein YedE/YeeE
MMKNTIALITGLLFGFGLALSHMVDPNKVLNFLDIAGNWDPSLAFVLGGAVAITLPMFRLVLRNPKPLLHPRFHLPVQTKLDRRLMIGAAIFGIGWGLAGYCPGPGISALVLGIWQPVVFVLALIGGSLAYRWVSNRYLS